MEYDDALPMPSARPSPNNVTFRWDLLPDIDFGDFSAHFGVHLHSLNLPYANFIFGANTSTTDAEGIRFSFPIDQSSAVLTDFDTHAVIATNDRLQITSPFPGDYGVDFTGHFVPGHLLLPSPDPSCASFDCMIPAQDVKKTLDSYQLQVFWGGQMVSEPGPYALFAVGIGLLVLLRRRRDDCSLQPHHDRSGPR